MRDKYFRDIYSFFSYNYIQVCFLECYDVKWLKEQGVMFEGRDGGINYCNR